MRRKKKESLSVSISLSLPPPRHSVSTMWRQWKCNHMKVRNRVFTRNQIEVNFYCLSQPAYGILLGQPEQTKMEGSLPRRLSLVLIGQNNITWPLLCQLLSRVIHSWNPIESDFVSRGQLAMAGEVILIVITYNSGEGEKYYCHL